MAGYDLNEGKYENREVTDDELWTAISCIFTAKSRNNTSYKYGFLKSILDNLGNADKDLTLTFDQIFVRFTIIYWDLIIKYGLRQNVVTSTGRKSQIEKIILGIKRKYGTTFIESYDNLPAQEQCNILRQVKTKCKTYVIGALFEDTGRLFYSFSKRGERLQFNPRMYRFLCENRKEINKLNAYEWAHFLHKVNVSYSANLILTKCFNEMGLTEINTEELKPRAEESLKKMKGCNDVNSASSSNEIEQIEELDEEAMKLLDDPIAMVKLIKKRYGFL